MSGWKVSTVMKCLGCEVINPNSPTYLLDKSLYPRLVSICKSGIITVAKLHGVTSKLPEIIMVRWLVYTEHDIVHVPIIMNY